MKIITRPCPPDHRPYRPAHLTANERTTRTDTHRQTWRQIGWHGQSGAFYTIGEDPTQYESASFSPLWLLVENEPIDDEGDHL